jgi:hypothetical protein
MSKGWKILNRELVRSGKEAVTAYFMTLSQYMKRKTEENHRILEWGEKKQIMRRRRRGRDTGIHIQFPHTGALIFG